MDLIQFREIIGQHHCVAQVLAKFLHEYTMWNSWSEKIHPDIEFRYVFPEDDRFDYDNVMRYREIADEWLITMQRSYFGAKATKVVNWFLKAETDFITRLTLANERIPQHGVLEIGEDQTRYAIPVPGRAFSSEAESLISSYIEYHDDDDDYDDVWET